MEETSYSGQGEGADEDTLGGGLDGLPVEVQQYVVTLLVGHKGALFSASLTCNLWRLLTQEDVVWRKYAVQEWGALAPRRPASSSSLVQRQEQPNDWLMLSFRRWRQTTSHIQEGSTWREMVRDTHQRLAAAEPNSYEWMCVCVEKSLKKLIQSSPCDWFTYGTQSTNLVLLAIDQKVPMEILKLLAPYKPNVHPWASPSDPLCEMVPLLKALQVDYEEAIDFLLELGTSPYYPPYCTPVHYAVYCGASKHVLEKLLEKLLESTGRPIFHRMNIDRPDQEQVGGSKWISFEKTTPLMEACASGNLDAMDTFLAWREPRVSPGQEGHTVRLNQVVGDELVLWVAVESLFKYALPPDPGATPEAASKQEARNERLWRLVGTLLEMGADPNLLLHGQVLLNSILQKELFLQGLEFLEKLIGLLIEHKVQADNQDERSGDTPLHVAARNEGYLSLMKLMLQSHPDINVQNKQGRAPVHEALLKEKREMAALLESHGANMQLPDIYGMTPAAIKIRERKEGAPAFDIFSIPPVPLVSHAGPKAAARNGPTHDSGAEGSDSSTFTFSFGNPSFSLRLPSAATEATLTTATESAVPRFPPSGPSVSFNFAGSSSSSSSSSSSPEGEASPADVLKSFRPPSLDTILASTSNKKEDKGKEKEKGKGKRGKHSRRMKGQADPLGEDLARIDWKVMGLSQAPRGLVAGSAALLDAFSPWTRGV